MKHPIIISVDVEDWQQSTWDRSLPVTKVSADNTLKLLEIFDLYKVKATMFIQGKFSEKFPNVVKEIYKCGHEIACHGHGHIEIFKQSRDIFFKDVERAKDNIENIIGDRVLGYRAPDFSITNKSLWALEDLIDLNFKYDSSIFPIKHNRYGIPSWPIYPKKIIINNQKFLKEFPITVIKSKSKNFPVGGGGYFRLIPLFIYKKIVDSVIKDRPFIFYMHPYELNSNELNELEFKIPYSTKLHQGLGRKGFKNKLIYFLENYKISNFKQELNSYGSDSLLYDEIKATSLYQ